MNRKDLPTKPMRRLVYSTRAVVSAHPSLYLPFAERKYRRDVEDRVVDRDTELVIEGFQRSGNTFAVVAFESAQRRPVRTAHHLHAAAQIVAAVRMGVPALVLIRDPADSVLSHMIREPGISAKQALANWVRFYEAVIPVRERVVIADFADVTTDLGDVIRRLNAKYGTDFEVFEHTQQNVDECFEVIEHRNRQKYGQIAESKVPRPSAEREGLKAGLREEFDAHRLEGLRTRAYRVYRSLVPSPSIS